MVRPATRSYSRYSLEALALLGRLLRTTRIERKLGTQALAERAGISRDLLYRIEKGDPRCEIGVVFELAAILGVPAVRAGAGRPEGPQPHLAGSVDAAARRGIRPARRGEG